MFDFSGKRVKCNGRVMTKYEICQTIHRLGEYWETLPYSLYPEIYSYQECVIKLKSLIK